MIDRILLCLAMGAGGAALVVAPDSSLTLSAVAASLLTGAAGNYFKELLAEQMSAACCRVP